MHRPGNTTTSGILLLDPRVLYISPDGNLSGDIEEGDLIVSLFGPTSKVEIEKTWHIKMLQTLRAVGYSNKVFVPRRFGADISSYTTESNAKELETIERIADMSNAVIYWQTIDLPVDTYLHGVAIMSLWNKVRRDGLAQKHNVLFGGDFDEGTQRLLEGPFLTPLQLYRTMESLCRAIRWS